MTPGPLTMGSSNHNGTFDVSLWGFVDTLDLSATVVCSVGDMLLAGTSSVFRVRPSSGPLLDPAAVYVTMEDGAGSLGSLTSGRLLRVLDCSAASGSAWVGVDKALWVPRCGVGAEGPARPPDHAALHPTFLSTHTCPRVPRQRWALGVVALLLFFSAPIAW
jgi:hypothetical protein